MKKIIIFTVIVVAIFGALAYVTTTANKAKVKDNPFGKDKLAQATIDQLDDPNYGNQILPEELEEKLDKNESVTVYFYASDCPHCQNTTPVVVPMVDEMGLDLKKFNLLEFKDGRYDYNIERTPTFVHFENGKEVSRLVGYRENHEEFKNWFQEVLNK